MLFRSSGVAKVLSADEESKRPSSCWVGVWLVFVPSYGGSCMIDIECRKKKIPSEQEPKHRVCLCKQPVERGESTQARFSYHMIGRINN